MSVVNFSIPKPLAQRIAEAIRLQGFASKAEFFRFAAMGALRMFRNPLVSVSSIDDDFAMAEEELASTIRRKFKGKKLPSLREQLADLQP